MSRPVDSVPASSSLAGTGREQTRARYPDKQGFVERDGVRLHYEIYGDGDQTVFFLPAWSIVHARVWKAQLPYFARHFRVLTFDGRGNGRSDRPSGASAYEQEEFAADALAVMDVSGTERAALVALSSGAQIALLLAGEQRERVDAAVFTASHVRLVDQTREELAEAVAAFETPRPSYEGWEKANAHYWAADYRGWLEFFFSECFSEPHSTKQIEDCVGYGLETSAETIIDTMRTRGVSPKKARDLCSRVRCPVLVIHGDEDRATPYEGGVALADALRAPLVTIEHGGHLAPARDPVKFNLLVRDFVQPRPPSTARWVRSTRRRKRALYLSSPIGLGHAQRDVAIADELRKLHPDLEIDWLAQHPVTAVLEARGERIHPASAHLANESGHIESESAEHDLHCFQAWRRMDEILVANFMVFSDLVRDEAYDLWVGDEAWELDYFLHENPELKTTPYAWLTDFVGWLPMPDGGDREAFLAADYNAEMIEHIARHPRLRDAAIFIGDPDDIVPQPFGADLPMIRDWTEEHYRFAGYVTGFDPADFADREALRAELGYKPDEAVCIVTVGGSGVGADLLRRVIAAFPEAKRRIPALRMVVVAGPRIDAARLGVADGLEVRPYVHQLYRHLAACDLAVVQGGLTTAMELTANRRPFLYFPLRHHFEQNFHVRHRLERYRAGRAMDFGRDGPEQIAAAIAEEIGRSVDYRPVDGGGALRAAQYLAELL